MNTYLEATKFAASRIIDIYARDFHELNGQIARYNAAIDQLRTSSEPKIGCDDDIRAFTAARESSLEIRRRADDLKAREFATRVLCGSLLQIAKQGISIVYGGLNACPNGRSIGSQPIKNVIWRARNQTMHYEENYLNAPTKASFNMLDADLGKTLSMRMLNENLAADVIDILGWHDYNKYEVDMVQLLP